MKPIDECIATWNTCPDGTMGTHPPNTLELVFRDTKDLTRILGQITVDSDVAVKMAKRALQDCMNERLLKCGTEPRIMKVVNDRLPEVVDSFVAAWLTSNAPPILRAALEASARKHMEKMRFRIGIEETP